MTTDLAEIAKIFGSSKPVFKANTQYEGSYINFVIKDKYDPSSIVSDDPVVGVLANFWNESYDSSTASFKTDLNIDRAFYNILAVVIDFYLCNSPLKNPKQTKLYKWLRSIDDRYGYKHPSAGGFISLFRYLHQNDLIEERDSQCQHTKNVLAILELMKDKYESK